MTKTLSRLGMLVGAAAVTVSSLALLSSPGSNRRVPQVPPGGPGLAQARSRFYMDSTPDPHPQGPSPEEEAEMQRHLREGRERLIQGGERVLKQAKELLSEDKIAEYMRLLPKGSDYSRSHYPRRLRDSIPDGTDRGRFVERTVKEIATLNLEHPTREQIDHRLELEDVLAETIAGMPEACSALIDLARSSQGREQEVAVLLLGRIDLPSALRFLIDEALPSPDPKLRQAAIEALAQDQGWNVSLRGGAETESGSSGGPIANPEIVAALLAALRSEGDPAVQGRLITALCTDLKELTLGGAAGDADRQAHPQGMHFGPQVLDAFRAVVLTTTDAEVRRQALACVAPLPAAGDLVLLVAKRAATPWDRAFAVEALGSRWPLPDDNLAYVREALRDENRQVRQAAIRSLAGSRRDDATCDLLHELYGKDPDGQVRLFAFLGAIQNLLDFQDRSGAPVSPGYARAFQLLDQEATTPLLDVPWQISAHGELERLDSAAKSGQFQPTPAQAERLAQLVAASRAAFPVNPEIEKARERMRNNR